MATGTVTITNDEKTASRSGLRRTKIAWTSTSGGAAGDTIQLDGFLTRVVFVPAAAPNAPTTLYDMTLTDDAGIDVFMGQGANLSATVANDVCPTIAAKDGTTTSTTFRSVLGAHTLAIAAAGDTKQGTIYLYLK